MERRLARCRGRILAGSPDMVHGGPYISRGSHEAVMDWQVSAGEVGICVQCQVSGRDRRSLLSKADPLRFWFKSLSFRPQRHRPSSPSPSMPSSESHHQSLTPYLPGAWPGSSRDHQDDTIQDADVSSVLSYGSTINRARKDTGWKARRRWTYTGPVRTYGASTIAPPGLTCSNLASLSPTISNDLKLSPVTDATVSDPNIGYL